MADVLGLSSEGSIIVYVLHVVSKGTCRLPSLRLAIAGLDLPAAECASCWAR